MATEVEGKKTSRKFGHVNLILNEKEYCIATKNNTATGVQLAKPPNVHPDFQSLTKDQLTKYQSPPTGGQNKTTDNSLPNPRRDIKGDSATDGSKH